ncbi:class I SAM-dependent methyltransferase [uncultured Tessaracoccus sp.]|uniref:class I SAM-dependent methyltransferase n=1 Tax=uncultured Tessaracoccus sp. TaxID=905023 RepID=UPI0025CB9D98|nr:class I SAM-dependent methyltransferase [uncultured Tessaracoccus sp.]
MEQGRLHWLLSRRVGAVEAVLSRSLGGARSPYDWLARSVSVTATRVLVLACGAGGMLERLDRDGRLVVGLDWSASSIAEAGRRGRGVLVQADANYLPFAEASFDAVVSDLGLAVNENRELMVAEAARVLRPGGMFAALTPSLRPMDFTDAKQMWWLTRLLRRMPQVPGETEFRVGELLRAAGLQKAEDARARFHFTVRNRADAEVLLAGLRAVEDADRAQQAVEQLARRAERHEVRIPLPFRRILALR